MTLREWLIQSGVDLRGPDFTVGEERAAVDPALVALGLTSEASGLNSARTYQVVMENLDRQLPAMFNGALVLDDDAIVSAGDSDLWFGAMWGPEINRYRDGGGTVNDAYMMPGNTAPIFAFGLVDDVYDDLEIAASSRMLVELPTDPGQPIERSLTLAAPAGNAPRTQAPFGMPANLLSRLTVPMAGAPGGLSPMVLILVGAAVYYLFLKKG